MEAPPLSEAEIYDIVLKEEVQLRPKAERMWEMIKIEPEKWHAPVYGSGSYSFWAVGIFGNRVLWYNEIEGEFVIRSEEHTSELQSLMRISYAVFCLKNKK